jgi:hypothetical protein
VERGFGYRAQRPCIVSDTNREISHVYHSSSFSYTVCTQPLPPNRDSRSTGRRSGAAGMKCNVVASLSQTYTQINGFAYNYNTPGTSYFSKSHISSRVYLLERPLFLELTK